MWDRFTELARKAVEEAQLEAGRLGENLISTEHLLLGILRVPDCAALRVLKALKITPSRVRSAVERHIARGNGRMDQMGFAPRAARAMTLAGDEAKRLGNEYIGTSHILLAIIREGEGLGGRALESLKVDLSRARREAASVGDVPGDGASAAQTNDQPGNDPDIKAHLRQKAEQQIYQADRISADAHGVVDGYIIMAVETARSVLIDSLSRDDVRGIKSSLETLNSALLALARAFYEARTAHLGTIPSADFDLAQLSGPSRAPSDHPDSERWDRFTQRARKVILFALGEASRRGSTRAEPMHLFLGVVREADSVAAHVLGRAGVDTAALAVAIESKLTAVAPAALIANDFDANAKRVFDMAFAEARSMYNNYIGTEHLLLALARDVNALPAQMLNNVGVTLAALQAELGSTHEIPVSASAAKPARSIEDEAPPSDSRSKRYTEILETANRLAAEHSRPEVTPVHIAMALFSLESGTVARVIDRLDVDRSIVGKLLDQAEEGIGATYDGVPAMSPAASHVVDQACSIWKEILGCRRVGTEHLLIALFDDVKLSSLLVAAGFEPKAVVAAIRRLYDEEG